MAKKVLVVDDDPHLCTLLQVRLSHDNYEVFVAPDSRTALRLVESVTPDLVIADIMMPEMDGFEFCQQFRARPEHREIPFIFLSARSSVDDRVRGLKIGADDYLAKPFDYHELAARMEVLLSRYERYRRLTPHLTAGHLKDLPLPDITQLFIYGRKTGRLELTRPRTGEEGALYFKEGRLAHGVCDPKQGVEAFYHLLSWDDGEFTFVPEVEPPDRSIDLEPEELLLEGTRRLDELSRILSEFPSREAAPVRSGDLAELPEFLKPLLDGSQSLEAILASSPKGDLETARELLRLSSAGVIHWREPTPQTINLLVVSVNRGFRDRFIGSLAMARRPDSAELTNFGRVELDHASINLLGIPGDPQFAQVWESFARTAHAWLILLDPDSPPELLKPAVDFFESSGKPGLVLSLGPVTEIEGIQVISGRVDEPEQLISALRELVSKVRARRLDTQENLAII